MRIAVVDDERPARSELIHQLTTLVPDAVLIEGDCGAAALKLAETERFDLFFLDINLGDINGTHLVNAIKTMQPSTSIIFVSAYSDYGVKAFELGVTDYIMKPYDKKRLEQVLDKCLQQKTFDRNFGGTRRIAMSINGKTIFEDIENIIYIETYNRGCLIHTVQHEYCENKAIGEYEKKLEEHHFFRIHKSYLINLNKVAEVFPWKNNSLSLKMQGYEENILPIGREKTKILKQLLGC